LSRLPPITGGSCKHLQRSCKGQLREWRERRRFREGGRRDARARRHL